MSDDYDVDPDQPSDHPDAPPSPFDDEGDDEFEVLESQLFMAAGQFENRWDKAWDAWVETTDMDEDEAAEMCQYPYDDEGVMPPEMTEWYAIYTRVKSEVEKEFGCEITVDTDGSIFAVYKLPDGETITVP